MARAGSGNPRRTESRARSAEMAPEIEHPRAHDESQAHEDAERAKEGLRRETERMAEDARHAAESLLGDQKDAAAEQVGSVARSLHRAADGIGEEQEWLSAFVHQAADGLDRVSQSIRGRSLGALFEDVQGFARRNPTLFLGLAVATGFALARFARSSAEPSRVQAVPESHAAGSASSPAASGLAGSASGSMAGEVPESGFPPGYAAAYPAGYPATGGAAEIGPAAGAQESGRSAIERSRRNLGSEQEG